MSRMSWDVKGIEMAENKGDAADRLQFDEMQQQMGLPVYPPDSYGKSELEAALPHMRALSVVPQEERARASASFVRKRLGCGEEE